MATPCSVKTLGNLRVPPNLMFQNGTSRFQTHFWKGKMRNYQETDLCFAKQRDQAKIIHYSIFYS